MELKRHGVSNDNSIAAAACWGKRGKLRQAGSDFYLGTEGSTDQFLRFPTSVLDASLLTELHCLIIRRSHLDLDLRHEQDKKCLSDLRIDYKI